jgi:phytanoyl-CoA hydroxylase
VPAREQRHRCFVIIAGVGLTPKQREAFREQGVVVVPDLFVESDFARLEQELSAWIDRRARELQDQGRIEKLYKEEPLETRYVRLFEQSSRIGAGLDIAYLRGEALFDFICCDPLLEAVESLIGPEISLSPIHHLRAKVPQRIVLASAETYLNVPWHQDSGVMWEEADPVPVVGVWIPLVDATANNGCMEAMPGVARGGHLPHQAEGGTTILPECLPRVDPIRLACRRGGAIFQDKFTPHRSTPNRSEVVRWSLDLRFQPTGTPTGRPFHPAFVVRSRSTPERVSSHNDWSATWQDTFDSMAGSPEPQAHRVVR